MSEHPGGQPQASETPSEALRAPSEAPEDGGGPPTHAHAPEPLTGFVWPCEKRIAHDRHDDCPGVRAHPNTMIGGGYR